MPINIGKVCHRWWLYKGRGNCCGAAQQEIPLLRPYFEKRTHRLCDSIVGGTFLWRDYFRTEYALAGETLFLRSRMPEDGSYIYSVPMGGDVTCGAVCGYVEAGGDVTCGTVAAYVEAGGDVTCGDVSGYVDAGGDVRINH